MQKMAKIKEIFTSIQGEGPFIGFKQLFIRFCGCNLACRYCDTDFGVDENVLELEPQAMIDYISELNLKNIHSVALTGGEPLLWCDFLKSFLYKLKALKLPIYLETNATLYDKIGEIIEYVDFISADIKIPSVSGNENSFEMHEKFFEAVKEASLTCAIHKHFDCDNKNIFAKVVFDNQITDKEISECIKLAERYNFELILQPRTEESKIALTSEEIETISDKFLKNYKNVRVIPQTHKFLNVR